MLWRESTRGGLRDVLPSSVVVVPIGAIEQHGPYLPVWTDSLIVSTVVSRAAGDDCVVAPTVSFGASDHHLPFGGTLSLSVETMLAVLLDLARSVALGGGRRLALVNGHGGNRGVCHAAAAAASTRYDLSVAYLDYWSVWQPAVDAPPWPGHAGRFETALVRAIRPDLVGDIPLRASVPDLPDDPGWDVHTEQLWHDIDGYTDDPSLATEQDGRQWLDALVAGLASRLAAL
jgi:creatinine amidohydrolase